MKNLACAALLLFFVGEAGCSKEHPAETAGSGPAYLRFIPADSPYYVAGLERLPPAYLDHALSTARGRLAKAVLTFRSLGGGPGSKLFMFVADELAANMSAEGFERLGLGGQVRGAFYGLGLNPVLRIEIQDGGKLRDFFTRAFDKSGVRPQDRKSGGHDYWWFALGEGVGVVVSIEGNSLVVAAAHEAALERFLPLVFGDQRPARSLADAGTVQKIIHDRGYGPWMLAYVDIPRVADLLTNAQAPERAYLGPMGAGLPSLSAECRAEVAGLLAQTPRLVMGMNELGVGSTRGSMTLDLRTDVVLALTALRVPVNGLGLPLGDSVLAFGGGLDIPRALELAKAKLDGIIAHPYQCEALAGLNDLARGVRADLGGSLPGWLLQLRGGLLVLDELSTGAGFSVKAHALLLAADPIKLIDLAKRLIPQLSGMSVPSDGKPVRLPAGGLLPDTYVAMQGPTLGLAMGKGADAALVTAMSAPPAPTLPFLVLAVDAARWNQAAEQLGDLGSSLRMDESTGRVEMSLSVDRAGLVLSFSTTTR